MSAHDWPHEVSYQCRCSQCLIYFYGPKRAPCCWECATPETQNLWLSKSPSPSVEERE